MAYSIDPIQDNCYPGTTVLVNKLHIHDEAALQEAEALAPMSTPPSWNNARWKAFLTSPTTRQSISFFSLTCTIGQGRSVR